MPKQKISKTNARRLLEQKKIPFQVHTYDPEKAISATEVAEILNEEPKCVFKTLVTYGKSGEHYVFVLPAVGELDLKKAAEAAQEKFIERLPQKDLLPLTGYIHGGCSPIGRKKEFPTFVDASAEGLEKRLVSGGKRGYQIEITPSDLEKSCGCQFVDLVK